MDLTGPLEDCTCPLRIALVLVRITWPSWRSHWSLWRSHDLLEDHTGPCEDHMTLVKINWSSWGSALVSFTKKLQPPNSRCVFLHVLPCFGFGMTWWHSSHGCGHCVHGSGCDCALKRRGMQRVHHTEISSDPNQIQHHFTTWLGDCISHMQWCCDFCDMSMSLPKMTNSMYRLQVPFQTLTS